MTDGKSRCVVKISTDTRPIVYLTIDRLSTDYRPTVDRLSTDYRPTLDRLSTAISTDISVDITQRKQDPNFFQDLVHTRLHGNERGTLSLFLRQVQKPCDVCLFGKLTSLPCKKQALPKELNKAYHCQYLQHLSVLLKHCTGFYGKQRKIERQVRNDIMYLD